MADGPKLAGTPVLLITTDPQPVVPGGTKGVTLINPGTIPIILSTDKPVTTSNSFTLQPNGASLPIAAGPLYASVSSGLGQLNIFPGILNVFNPNVLVTNSPTSINLINDPLAQISANTVQETITVPNGIKTLVIRVNTGNTQPVNNVLVTDIVFGISGLGTPPIYYNQAPYLVWPGTGVNIYYIVVPIMGEVDADLQRETDATIAAVFTFGGAATGQADIVINGYYDRFQESIFYNGVLQAASQSTTGASTTLITGPARLLTANLTTSVNTTQGKITVAGNTIMNTFTAASLTFPPNTIVKAGQVVAVASTAATAVGSVGYAYP